MKIFLSSTYTDLKSHRSVLLDTLMRMGDDVDVLAMEYFGANPESPVETSISTVKRADIYIGVFGWKYGTVDKKSGMSITEIEYRTALANGMPVYLYLISDDSLVKPNTVETGPGAKKILRLRNEILGMHVVQFFSTPEDLARLVVTDLHKFLKNPPPKSNDISNLEFNSPVTPEINPAHPFLLYHHSKPLPNDHYEVLVCLDLYDETYEETFKKIDKVVYQLHETFNFPVIPMQNWKECYLLKLIVYGEFWIRATIIFKDKTIAPISLIRYINLYDISSYQKKPETRD